MPQDMLWLPSTQIYGEPGAGAGFLTQLSDLLIEIGFRQMIQDPNAYVLADTDGPYHGTLALSTDDIFSGGDDHMDAALNKIHERFPLGERQVGGGVYCGVQWGTLPDGTLQAHQNPYIASIDQIPVTTADKTTPERRLTEGQELALRTLVGTMHFCVTRTRPAEAAQVSMLQSSLHKARIRHIVAANKLLRRMRETPNEVLTFRPMPGDAVPVALTDAALANRPDGKTQGAYMVGIHSPSTGLFHLIGWKSKALKKVCHDSTQAETRQAQYTLQAIEGFVMQLQEMQKHIMTPPATFVTDCLDLMSKTFSLKAGFKDPRLTNIVVELRDSLRDGTLGNMIHIPGNQNPCDALTKLKTTTRKFLVHAVCGRLTLPAPTGKHNSANIRS